MIKYNNKNINDIIFKKSDIKINNDFINILNKLKEEIKQIKFENNHDKHNDKHNDRHNDKHNDKQNDYILNKNSKTFDNLRNYKSKIINS